MIGTRRKNYSQRAPSGVGGQSSQHQSQQLEQHLAQVKDELQKSCELIEKQNKLFKKFGEVGNEKEKCNTCIFR